MCRIVKYADWNNAPWIGAGIGAVTGGVIGALPSSEEKKNRWKRALMLIGAGAMSGVSLGFLLEKRYGAAPNKNIPLPELEDK